MKLKDLTIGTRLTLGFGSILILVVLIGIISIKQSSLLWKNTDDLYNHPLIVGRTVRDIESNILKTHIIMKDIALEDEFTDYQIKTSEKKIDTYETEIYAQFDTVYSRYLGARSTIDTAFKYFNEWKPLRNELISLRLKNGRMESSALFNTVNKHYVERMIAEIDKMIAFSNNKAATFYNGSETEKNLLIWRLKILLFSILILSGSILYVLVRAIRSPLKELSDVADKYRQGQYNIRSNYESANEIGTLASAFNKMASSVFNDITVKENAVWISKLMMDENELKPFCKGLLKALLSKTESQVAAIYFLNRSNGFFEHFESIGLSNNRKGSFSAISSEGEFGSVISEKKIMRITNISDDTVLSFSAVTGDYKPKEIITIPVIESNEVIAVISLASIKEYSDLSTHLISDIWLTMTARILGVLSFQKITDFSVTLDIQNKELEQKSRELVMQADELKEYNIELELQKKQLDDSNRLKSAFLSNMSHELRTPLNSVIALSGVLSRRLSGIIPDDEYNYLGIIEKNGKNLLSLINDILDLSRIESGKEELSYSEFSLSEMVHEILNSLETIIIEKGISVTCSIRNDLQPMVSDKTKCHHIIQNLISNAIKFTESGSVEISAFIEMSDIKIVVKDTGIGIPEDFIPFLFDEFRQAEDKASRRFGGTGLGLSIVKKYCQLLNGSVEVKSTEGSGSVFTVVLPVKPESVNISEDGMALQRDSGSTFYSSSLSVKKGGGKKLLLVEDSEPQIIQLINILSDEGFVIQVARNGREAIESLKYIIPDAIILDLQMPEIDGFEVLKQIRNLNETKGIPVLILTARHITKTELSFLKENHIYQLIQKGSLNRNDLLAYVKNLMVLTSNENEQPLATVKSHKKTPGKPKILVIEDNHDNLITVMALLNERFAVSSAKDGQEGLEKVISVLPDLVLLDISLPVMDGFKVLDEIKKNEDLKGIQVIALTARAMKGDREDLIAHGFDGYISKPIDNDTFEETIRGHLERV